MILNRKLNKEWTKSNPQLTKQMNYGELTSQLEFKKELSRLINVTKDEERIDVTHVLAHLSSSRLIQSGADFGISPRELPQK